MKKILLVGAVIVIAGVAGAHWYFSDRGRFTTPAEYTNLARTVDGNNLVSTFDPSVVLRFAPEYEYLGGQKFVLYGVADTEQHFFVEKRADGRLKSIYWVQYEAYLPGKPYKYHYEDSPLRLQLGDYEFFTDTAVFYNDPTIERRRGTDGAMVREFLASKGLGYPDQVMYARIVYLTDESKQKELMIIFMDDLADYGYTAADLQEGGDHQDQYVVVEQAHLERIQNTLTLLPVVTE